MSKDRYTLHLGDCLDVMAEMPDACVDAVICDPPYGTTACKWDSIVPLDAMWRELKRITKPGGAIVLFGSQPFTSVLIMSNLNWFRCEWIWHKSNGGGFLNVNKYPLKRHENITVFSERSPVYNPQMWKDKPYRRTRAAAGETTEDQSVAGWVTVNDGSRYPTTVLFAPNDTGHHPTQKPVSLLRYLVLTHTNAGDAVLDFTMGSGTTGVACIKTGREFIGIEIEREYFEVAQRRIEDATRQPELF